LYVVLSLRPLVQKTMNRKFDIFPPLKVELCTISTNIRFMEHKACQSTDSLISIVEK
jgi:hypothetical protein